MKIQRRTASLNSKYNANALAFYYLTVSYIVN